MTRKVTITVSGAVDSGKCAICGDIERALRAIGLQVEWDRGEYEPRIIDWRSLTDKPEVVIFDTHERSLK